MSRSDLEAGRSNQKLRTRQALLEAAKRLMASGETVTIDAVAAEAGVSRATAYRYFKSSEKLVYEAGLDSVWNALGLEELDLHPSDVVKRVSQLHQVMWENARSEEVPFRLYLSSALRESVESEGGENSRGGRRLPLIETVLEPARAGMSPEAFERLRDCLAFMLGADSMIPLRDICGLSYEEARSASLWAVQQLVRASLSEQSD